MSYTIEQLHSACDTAILKIKRETKIVAWMVGLPEQAAMYNLSEKEKAFSAARRWNSPITALAIHPDAPDIVAPTVSRSL